MLSAVQEDIRVRELLRRNARGSVVVLGAGVTGKAVARLLARGGYRVTVLDQKGIGLEQRTELEALGVRCVERFTPTPESLAALGPETFAFAVLSPGVPLDGPLTSVVGRAGIPRISEIDLAVAYLGMPDVAVTGTNGKTTTVTLIHEMIRGSGTSSALVGNVGSPLVDLIDPAVLASDGPLQQAPLLVCEVSSYQLEAAFDFVPRIGVWLNIDDDHLERHGSLNEYLRIKARIFAGQSRETDWSLIWADDPAAGKMKELSRGRYFPFGLLDDARLNEPYGSWLSVDGSMLLLKLPQGEERYSLAEWRPLGRHNKLNLAAAVAAARLAGAQPAAVREVIAGFHLLPHRIEVVGEHDGVVYINDSKATNVSAVRVAIETVREAVPNAKLILLVGGRMKEGSFAPLREVLFPGTRAIIGFGADGGAVLEALGLSEGRLEPALGYGAPLEVMRVSTLEEAVACARRIAAAGDVVLLSPACSSFDAYSDYAARGEHFRRIAATVPREPAAPPSGSVA